uniref:Uncharacterized protein n=1 Tax=Physcomitrium patens TaxID=3218 RepID=A0A2K1J540_PHYPA|nr:hypothetical protein PHYPA_022497 [Physcomitrium patens]
MVQSGGAREAEADAARSDGARLPGLLVRFSHMMKLVLRCNQHTVSIYNGAMGNLPSWPWGLCGRFLARRAKADREGSPHCCSIGGVEELTVKRLRGFATRNLGLAEHVLPGPGSIKTLCVKDMRNAELLELLRAGSKSSHILILIWLSGSWDILLEIITEQMRSSVEFQLEKVCVTYRRLKAVGRWSNLQVLFLVKPTECTNQWLLAVASGCSPLRKLHLDVMKSSRVGHEGLLMVARKCEQLQKLVIIGVSPTTATLRLLASICPGLERLATCTSEIFGDPELCIADKCLALRKLCIKGCLISNREMEASVSGCPSLVKMKVKKCRAGGGGGGGTPASVW